MRGAILPLPNTPSWRGAPLKKAQGQLYRKITTWRPPILYEQFLYVKNHKHGDEINLPSLSIKFNVVGICSSGNTNGSSHHISESAGSSVSVVNTLRTERPGFNSMQGQLYEIFSSPPAQQALGPIQWVPGIKRPGREHDHSPPSSAEVMNAWSYNSTLPYVLLARRLVKHRANFTSSTHTYPNNTFKGLHGRVVVGEFLLSGFPCHVCTCNSNEDQVTRRINS
jgi:hypothetical protein